MDVVFLKNFNMSLTACWLILAVIVLRLLLNKAPKHIRVVMWGLVGIRLICPFSIKSIFSLIPSNEIISLENVNSPTPSINTGINAINNVANPIIAESFGSDTTNTVFPLQIINMIASNIWIIGIIAMILYMLISYIKIHKTTKEAIILKDNIYLCDHIATPFILGLIKPKIYIPSSMSEADIEYVTAHEYAHIKRHDHWWKPLGFILLTIHWFNPLVWVAYILLCRDIELACDERVINQMGAEIKKPYSQALINCSISNRKITACPLAFGEVSVKKRIKTILKYKQPAFWLSITAVVACGAVALCFLTNPTGIKINQINDFTGVENLFNNINTIKIVKFDNSIKVEDVDTTLKNLQKIKLDPNPITIGKLVDSDTSYKLVINNSVTLHFNEKLNTMHIQNGTEISYCYIIKNPKVVQEIFFNAPYLAHSIKYPIEWIDNPILSSGTGDIIFQLAFAEDYFDNSTDKTGQITATCSNGTLWDLSTAIDQKEVSNTILTQANTPIHWQPGEDPKAGTEIDFTIYHHGHDVFTGTIVVRYISDNPDSGNKFSSIVTYDVSLQNCTELCEGYGNFYLQQGTDENDGFIFITDKINAYRYMEDKFPRDI
ncbi:MAG: M56 family metallopeptidase [Acutalibacteraceae bacterium]|nr:M56 family metallopeptidase [Acutalibacteraceae bacterium]